MCGEAPITAAMAVFSKSTTVRSVRRYPVVKWTVRAKAVAIRMKVRQRPICGDLYLVVQAKENPSAFMGLLGKLVPSPIAAEVTQCVAKVTDEIMTPKE